MASMKEIFSTNIKFRLKLILQFTPFKFVVIIILVPEVSIFSAKFATVVNVAIAIRKFSDSDIKRM